MRLIKKYNTGGSTADRIAALRDSYNKTKRFDNKEKSDETKVEQPRKLTSTDVKVKSLRLGDIYPVKETTISKYDPNRPTIPISEIEKRVDQANQFANFYTNIGQPIPYINKEAVLNNPARGLAITNAAIDYGANSPAMFMIQSAAPIGRTTRITTSPITIGKAIQTMIKNPSTIVKAPARFVAKHPVGTLTTVAPALMSFDGDDNSDWITGLSIAGGSALLGAGRKLYTVTRGKHLGRGFWNAVKYPFKQTYNYTFKPLGQSIKAHPWTWGVSTGITGGLGYAGYSGITDYLDNSNYEDKIEEQSRGYKRIDPRDL